MSSSPPPSAAAPPTRGCPFKDKSKSPSSSPPPLSPLPPSPPPPSATEATEAAKGACPLRRCTIRNADGQERTYALSHEEAAVPCVLSRLRRDGLTRLRSLFSCPRKSKAAKAPLEPAPAPDAAPDVAPTTPVPAGDGGSSSSSSSGGADSDVEESWLVLTGLAPRRLKSDDVLTDLPPNAELVLMTTLVPPPPPSPPPPATAAVIKRATKHLPPLGGCGTGLTSTERFPPSTFDLQPIATSLYLVSKQMMDALTPRTAPATEPLPPPEPTAADSSSSATDVDPEALAMLNSMGFATPRAVKALQFANMDVSVAMEWLLSHEGDPDVDTPLPRPAPRLTASGSTFTPSPAVFQRLRDMGFGPDENIVAAMQLFQNSFDLACEFLLSGQDVHAALAAKETPTLDLTNPVVKALLEDAKVQCALQDPRIFRVLEDMQGDAMVVSLYLGDPIIGSTLIYILNTITKIQRDLVIR